MDATSTNPHATCRSPRWACGDRGPGEAVDGSATGFGARWGSDASPCRTCPRPRGPIGGLTGLGAMCGRNTRFGHAAPVGSPTVLERRTRVRVSSGRGVDPGEGKAVLKVLVVAGRGWRTHEKPELGFLDGLDRVLPPEHRSALQIRAAEHHERFDGDERCPAWPEVAFPMVQVGSAFTRCPCCPNGPESFASPGGCGRGATGTGHFGGGATACSSRRMCGRT